MVKHSNSKIHNNIKSIKTEHFCIIETIQKTLVNLTNDTNYAACYCFDCVIAVDETYSIVDAEHPVSLQILHWPSHQLQQPMGAVTRVALQPNHCVQDTRERFLYIL